MVKIISKYTIKFRLVYSRRTMENSVSYRIHLPFFLDHNFDNF